MASTCKTNRAQKFAAESIGADFRVRIDRNTVWAGKITEAEAIIDEQTNRPMFFRIKMETPSGAALGPFDVQSVPKRR